MSGLPFGPAYVRRGLTIGYQVEQYTYAGGWAVKDISAARWTYEIRAWEAGDDDDFLIRETISKSATEAESGMLDYYLALGTTVYATPLSWELIEVDNDNTDASTKSTKRERVLLSWSQPIVDAPPNA